jgi:hypothetical protein
MKHRIPLLILLVMVIWLAASLVRVENQRYALQTGLCRDSQGLTDFKCLEAVQTRTGWLWHLFYALRG